MSVEASRAFAQQHAQHREALMLEREYWSLAMRDPELRERYAARQRELRRQLAAAMEARAHDLGTPELTLPADDLPAS